MKSKLKRYCQKFGAKVKQLREDKGLTVQELSAQSGLPEYYIEQVENGKTSSSHFTRNKMSEVLNVDLEPVAKNLYDDIAK